MSTENIREQAKAARQALGQLNDSAESRVRQIERNRRGLQTERTKIVAGARLAMEDVDHEDRPLEEEQNELKGRLRPPEERRPVFDQDAPENASPANAEGADASASAAATAEASAEAAANARAAAEASAHAAANPTTPQPAVVVEPERSRSPYHPRNWHISCWLFAVLGGIIGFVVGMNTHYLVTDEVDAWEWIPGVIWVVAIIGIGFFLFGLLCAFVREQLNRPRAAQA